MCRRVNVVVVVELYTLLIIIIVVSRRMEARGMSAAKSMFSEEIFVSSARKHDRLFGAWPSTYNNKS